MKSENSEFYIGWQPEAPDGIARRVRQFILAVCFVVPMVGAVLVLNQSGFANSRFEYGQPTELEGELVLLPAPFLRIHRGSDVEGNPVHQNVLLVAPGKHGFRVPSDEAMPDGTTVRLRGYLIFHEGKTLMEVESVHQPSNSLRSEGLHSQRGISETTVGGGAFIGEVTDPKCLFGVMKPGYGKPHRACAARCIAGGIPPVLRALAADGKVQHYLLAGPHGEPLNGEVLPFVGDQVLVCGTVKKMGDWLVLYKDAGKPLGLAPPGMEVGLPMCR